ncbi:MAG TPA: Tad domain-containing protein [Chloroflexota bacterium]|jgi:Flp pilus assembly protein TadG
MTRGAQRAQALVFFVVALPTFVAMAGLAIDGALLLAQRRQLQSTVDGAARAGATRLDMELMRASGGSDVHIDIALARLATNVYLTESLDHTLPWRTPPEARIEVTRTRVRVSVEGRVPTAFMRIVGVDQVALGATADAAAQYGIRAPTP